MVRVFSLRNCEYWSTYRLLIVPPNHWGENESGPSTNTFYPVSAGARLSSCNPVDAFPQENVYTHHQPRTGPVGTGLVSAGQFQPYGIAEVGPPILLPSPIPYVGHQTQQPSGGTISETTADAKILQTIIEEDKVPVSNFYCSHIPRVIEWSSGVRRLSERLSAPVFEDHLAPTVSRWRRIPPSCSTGCGRSMGPRKL